MSVVAVNTSLTALSVIAASNGGLLPSGVEQPGFWDLERDYAQVLGDYLRRQRDPIGPILNWQMMKGLREPPPREEMVSPLLRGIEGFLAAHKVRPGLIDVNFDHGLKLQVNAPHDVSEAEKNILRSALVALFETSISLLGEVNEQGFAVRYFGPHRMVRVPKGPFVMGAADLDESYHDCPPHWVELTRDFWIAEQAVSEGLYRLFGGEGGNPEATSDHPVTEVSWHEAMAYIKALNTSFGVKTDLLTEAQWERAARGGWVDMKAGMEAEGVPFTHESFLRFADGRFENFVPAIEMGADIYTDLRDGRIARILKNKTAKLFGLRQYSTPSGRLSKKEVWFDQRGLETVNWGPRGPFGTRNMNGNVWEWVQDCYAEIAYRPLDIDPTGPDGDHLRVLRGGSWFNNDSGSLRAGPRGNSVLPDKGGSDVGFRIAAPVLNER